MATENKFTIKQGYAGTITFTIKDSDGDAVNLAGNPTIYFTVKNRKSDTDANALLAKDTTGDVTIVTAASGIITVAFTQAETAALEKNATCEITIKYNATNVVKTKDIHLVLDKSIRIATV